MALIDQILYLTRSLYPTGRAFRIPRGGVLEKLHRGLAVSETQFYTDSVAILDSILPDNANFTVDDADQWETRLGLITNEATALADRMAAIKRKMNHPGTIKARQHYLYIQGQLQAAGFNVYVYENISPDGSGGYVTRDPLSIVGSYGLGTHELGDLELGDFELGSSFTNIIANHIEEALDSIFDVGSNLRSTFFVGAGYFGQYANVPYTRKDEFRQLILKLKPAQEVGYLFINYI